MIVYRKQEQTAALSHYVARMKNMLRHFSQGGRTRHEQAVELLIEYGEFESGITDALNAKDDSDGRTVRALRQAAIVAGRIFCRSWEGNTGGLGAEAERLDRALGGLVRLGLPDTISVRVPEGYAHYSLYPETYLEAAKRFFHEEHPVHVACVGARSIGTSLSAVVSAVLEDLGCKVTSYTMRPRGHPFHRRILLTPRFEKLLSALDCSHFAVIDEGPGLSGTSLCCVAQQLSELGIPDDRIVIFPSWNPDGSNFISGAARERWLKHRKYVSSFEEVWLANGRLKQYLPFSEFLDISAGRWRYLFYRDEASFPAVHPHHERRKYLCAERIAHVITQAVRRRAASRPRGQSGRRSDALFVKFAGLGRYGRLKLERASLLARAGFYPPVYGLANGFLVMQFVHGTPVSGMSAEKELLDALTRYLSHLRKTAPAGQGPKYDELAAMVRRNISLGLGDQWVKKLSSLEKFRGIVSDCRAVAVDGRMLPHEWFLTPQGYMKMDGIDHHADQFFPGCQDIAWDVAGVLAEFAFGKPERDYFLGRYCSLGDDGKLRERLPFYSVAYLSYRLGYVTFAANELGTSSDGLKFRMLGQRYSTLLKEELLRLSG